jgi:hypothetical protein
MWMVLQFYCSQSDVTLNSALGAPQRSINYKFSGQWAAEAFDMPAIDKSVIIIQGKGAGK